MPHSTDIICISSIDWDFIWQGHQEIMSTLAASPPTPPPPPPPPPPTFPGF
jgi:hypothetical protein